MAASSKKLFNIIYLNMRFPSHRLLTFVFCTIQMIDATRNQLIAESCLTGLPEEMMVHQLTHTRPFYGESVNEKQRTRRQIQYFIAYEPAHADLGKLMKVVGQRTRSVGLPRLRQTITNAGIGGYYDLKLVQLC